MSKTLKGVKLHQFLKHKVISNPLFCLSENQSNTLTYLIYSCTK